MNLLKKLRLMHFFRAKRPSLEVVERISRETFDAGERLDLNEYYHRDQTGSLKDKSERFFKMVHDRLRATKTITIVLNQKIEPLTHAIGGSDMRGDIGRIHFERPASLRLVNLSIGVLQISHDGVQVKLEDCDVAQLWINSHRAELTTRDTNIGVLNLQQNALKHFEMVGGCLLNINCPSPHEPNPFTGTVSFSADVFFPRDRHRYLLKGPQPYRNLRHHLRDLENAQMANLVHSAELAAERDDDSWPNRIISRMYELFSDFGSSALRPLVWLLGLAAISFFATYFTSGATLTLPSEQYVGWQSILLRNDFLGDTLKALYVSFQPIANPLGVFAKTPLLTPESPWLALWLTVQGLLSVVLIALAIFAIRRRFKIAS